MPVPPRQAILQLILEQNPLGCQLCQRHIKVIRFVHDMRRCLRFTDQYVARVQVYVTWFCRFPRQSYMFFPITSSLLNNDTNKFLANLQTIRILTDDQYVRDGKPTESNFALSALEAV